MSDYFIVRVHASTAPEGLEVAFAKGELALSVRGRPADLVRAARLESAELASALLSASHQPLQHRCGDGTRLVIQQFRLPLDDSAERIARDSDAAREWLATLPVAPAEGKAKAKA